MLNSSKLCNLKTVSIEKSSQIPNFLKLRLRETAYAVLFQNITMDNIYKYIIFFLFDFFKSIKVKKKLKYS